MDGISISIDWGAIGTAVVNALLDGVQKLMSPIPQQLMEWLISSLQGLIGGMNILTTIPPELTTQSGVVRGLWNQFLAVEAAFIGLAVLVQGFRVIIQKTDGLDAIARVGLKGALGFATVFFCEKIFAVVNSLSAWVGGGVPLDMHQGTPPLFVNAILMAIALVLALLAWLKALAGIIFLDVLIILIPPILVLSEIPYLAGLLAWWLEEFITWTLRPVLVALAFRLGFGLGFEQLGVIQPLLAIVAFWLAWSMDTRMKRFSVGAIGSLGQASMAAHGGASLASGARAAAGAVTGGVAAAGSAVVGTAGTALRAYGQRLYS